jgi:DNA-binding IclR family transcriptional regulator
VLEHHDAVFVATFETPRPVRIHAPLGSRAPAHCTATGKAILAFLPPAKVEFLNHQLAAVTKSSLSGDRLLADLERVRRRGYAINLAEWQEGVNGVAVPIFMGSNDDVIASVGIFGPAERLNQNTIRRHLPLIQNAAKRITAAASQTGLS